MKKFYSNGKLLITGEYVVLDRAKALALPTKKGQYLTVEITDTSYLKWESYDCNEKIWYTTQIQVAEFLNPKAPLGDSEFDTTLFKILWQAQQLNPKFLNDSLGYTVKTYLSFDRLWGLGSSSTLINNIANWANINAFELLNLSFGGSGYDIACAQNNTPIYYKKTKDFNKPKITPIAFDPPFKESIFFVYLNKKKNSKEAISAYNKLEKSELSSIITKINLISSNIVKCDTLKKFEKLITKHETIISSLLNIPTIKTTHFPDFKGAIKSLGGWGGDFIMVTGNKSNMDYFSTKGYHTIIPYKEMIL